MSERDVFICHATADKALVLDPIVAGLTCADQAAGSMRAKFAQARV